ncbi:MAG TPA: cation diffusion facilitator family transporter [Planctomycetota bacterium]|nr:cation diffusion facilitator family transporter [Planctomycetota bacterium]
MGVDLQLPEGGRDGRGVPDGGNGVERTRQAVGAARASVVTASLLGGMKLLAAIFTGSLAMAASFVDSLMDVFASSVNLIAVRIGGRPADADHRYGHGKAEGLAGMFQGAVVGFSGLFLAAESVRRLVVGGVVTHEAAGLVVMAVSTAASVWITWLLRRTAKATGSVALSADSVHYASDVWMNAGVFAALLAVRLTGAPWIDAAVGLGVAGIVVRSSWSVLKASLDELMDRDMGPAVERDIRSAIAQGVPEARVVRDVKTRRAGPNRFVDLTVGFDRRLAFAEAHRLSEKVRRAVAEAVPGAEVNVHADPDPLVPADHAS